MGAVCIAEVDHSEIVEDFDVEIDVVGAGFVGSSPDCSWSESRSRTIRGGKVEGSADDGDVGLPAVEIISIGHERLLSKGGETAKVVAELQLLAHTRGQQFVARIAHAVRLAMA